MRPALALLLNAIIAAPALSQQPAPQPPPTPPAGVQPAKPMTGSQPAALPTGSTPMTIQPVEPPKPNAIPVPDGPAISKKELEGGLIIEDIKLGDGYEVKPGGAVVAYYHGTLKSDGTIFDSAYERGEPVAFPLSGVIKGWQNGVPGMKIGGVRRLTIPADMAYGASSRPKIPANSDLVFIIQLVDALRVEEVKAGEGDAAEGRFVAVTTYSMKDASGKEIEKADAAHPYIWVPNEMQGMQFGLEGMKPGGKRHLHIPKEMNASSPMSGTTRPQKVPLDVDVELVACRNLNPRPPAPPPPPPAPTGSTPAPTGSTPAPTGGAH